MCIPDREFVFLDYINLHLLVTLLGTLSFYWFGPSFPLRTALILFSTVSARYWKHSSKIYWQIDWYDSIT